MTNPAKLQSTILATLNASDKPLSQRALGKAVRARGETITGTAFAKTLRGMEEDGKVTVELGARRAQLYWLPGIERPREPMEALEAVQHSEAVESSSTAAARTESRKIGPTLGIVDEPHWLLRPPDSHPLAPIEGDPFSIPWEAW